MKPQAAIQGMAQKPGVPAVGSLSSSITVQSPRTLVFGVCMKQRLEPHPTGAVAGLGEAAMP